MTHDTEIAILDQLPSWIRLEFQFLTLQKIAKNNSKKVKTNNDG